MFCQNTTRISLTNTDPMPHCKKPANITPVPTVISWYFLTDFLPYFSLCQFPPTSSVFPIIKQLPNPGGWRRSRTSSETREASQPRFRTAARAASQSSATNAEESASHAILHAQAHVLLVSLGCIEERQDVNPVWHSCNTLMSMQCSEEIHSLLTRKLCPKWRTIH